MTSKLKAKIAGLRKSPPSRLITWDEAANEIAATLNIPFEAATMTLYGLCLIGGVRWSFRDGEVVEPAEITLYDFSKQRISLVEADDVRSCLVGWSDQPQQSQRDRVIAGLLAEGVNSPRSVEWKSFYKLVRDKCNGWLGSGRPALGFGDKQIQRVVKELKSK